MKIISRSPFSYRRHKAVFVPAIFYIIIWFVLTEILRSAQAEKIPFESGIQAKTSNPNLIAEITKSFSLAKD